MKECSTKPLITLEENNLSTNASPWSASLPHQDDALNIEQIKSLLDRYVSEGVLNIALMTAELEVKFNLFCAFISAKYTLRYGPYAAMKQRLIIDNPQLTLSAPPLLGGGELGILFRDLSSLVKNNREPVVKVTLAVSVDGDQSTCHLLWIKRDNGWRFLFANYLS